MLDQCSALGENRGQWPAGLPGVLRVVAVQPAHQTLLLFPVASGLSVSPAVSSLIPASLLKPGQQGVLEVWVLVVTAMSSGYSCHQTLLSLISYKTLEPVSESDRFFFILTNPHSFLPTPSFSSTFLPTLLQTKVNVPIMPHFLSQCLSDLAFTSRH